MITQLDHTRPDLGQTDFVAARKAMIDSQLRTSGVNEGFVLDRMAAVPREDFVPPTARATAYMDRAIRLADGGFLAAPVFHGAMLAEAQPTAADRVLVIDAGSGYLPELIRPLVAALDVVTPEQGADGQAQGGYSLILIDGAVEHVPESLGDLLDGDGRLVTGLVERGVTRLATGRRAGATLGLVALAEMGIPRLGAFDKPAGWTF